MPVARAAAPEASIFEMGTAGAPGLTAGSLRSSVRPERPPLACAAPSLTEPQVMHSPQRPAHFMLCQPHSLHEKTAPTEDFAMAGTVSAGSDSAAGQAA
jgi:hypothetical protein